MGEREAIAQLKQGNIDGLETLVRMYQVQAVRTAYLITRDRALAEDIVQAAFLRAYERIDQFDPDRPFVPWFLRSVANDAVKAATRRESQRSLDSMASSESVSPEDLFAESAIGPEAMLEQMETRQAVRDALRKLSPTQRAVVAQRYYLGMSENEMAANLACPPGTIKSRLNAARERLRLLLRPLRLGE